MVENNIICYNTKQDSTIDLQSSTTDLTTFTTDTAFVTTTFIDVGIPPVEEFANYEEEEELEPFYYEEEEENDDYSIIDNRLGGARLDEVNATEYFVSCQTNMMCLYISKQLLNDKGVIESEYNDFMFQNGNRFDENGMTCGRSNFTTNPDIDSESYLSFCSFPNEVENTWSCGTEMEVRKFIDNK